MRSTVLLGGLLGTCLAAGALMGCLKAVSKLSLPERPKVHKATPAKLAGSTVATRFTLKAK